MRITLSRITLLNVLTAADVIVLLFADVSALQRACLLATYVAGKSAHC